MPIFPPQVNLTKSRTHTHTPTSPESNFCDFPLFFFFRSNQNSYTLSETTPPNPPSTNTHKHTHTHAHPHVQFPSFSLQHSSVLARSLILSGCEPDSHNYICDTNPASQIERFIPERASLNPPAPQTSTPSTLPLFITPLFPLLNPPFAPPLPHRKSIWDLKGGEARLFTFPPTPLPLFFLLLRRYLFLFLPAARVALKPLR